MYDYYKAKLAVNNSKVANWFDSRRDQFATYLFLEKGLVRFSDTTSNAAEQYNNILEQSRIRKLPVIELINQIIIYSSGQYWKRQVAVQQMIEEHKAVTTATLNAVAERLFASKKYQVDILQLSDVEVVAQITISSNPPRVHTITLKQNDQTAKAVTFCGQYKV